jgi:microcystin-dependent protein
MAEPFLAEIRIMSFNFAPKGWAMCNGQFLPINQNQALFSLLGTVYGGNGQTTFALPDLRGRVPIYTGHGHTLGERGGEQSHTVTAQEMPQHIHMWQATSAANNANPPTPIPNILADSAPALGYNGGTGLVGLNGNTVTRVGGSQAHQNMQPFLALNFCIALQGIFPSRN